MNLDVGGPGRREDHNWSSTDNWTRSGTWGGRRPRAQRHSEDRGLGDCRAPDIPGSVCDLVLTGAPGDTATANQTQWFLTVTSEAKATGLAAAPGSPFTLRIAGTLLLDSADATFDRISLELAGPPAERSISRAKKLTLADASRPPG